MYPILLVLMLFSKSGTMPIGNCSNVGPVSWVGWCLFCYYASQLTLYFLFLYISYVYIFHIQVNNLWYITDTKHSHHYANRDLGLDTHFTHPSCQAASKQICLLPGRTHPQGRTKLKLSNFRIWCLSAHSPFTLSQMATSLTPTGFSARQT